MGNEQATSVGFGSCDEAGNRRIRLVSVVTPSSPTDQIQWLIDGAPFGPPMAPGEYNAKVPGDGNAHRLELRVVSPEDGEGDVAEIEFPKCESKPELVAHIRSIDFGSADGRSRPIRLVSVTAPADAEALVQWSVDGEPLGEPVAVGVFTAVVPGDGQSHQIGLRLVSPEGEGDLETVRFPTNEVARGKIEAATFAEGDHWIIPA